MKIPIGVFVWLLVACFSAAPLTAQKKGGAPLWLPASTVATSQDISSLSSASDIVKAILSTHYRKPFEPFYIAGMVRNPLSGPFLFESDQREVIVAASDAPTQELINAISLAKNILEVKYHVIDVAGWPNSIRLDPTAKVLRANGNLPANQANIASRIKLTPGNLAEMLSRFSFWDGVSFDAKSNQLYLIGNNQQSYPQIAESDTIAAYNAIFNHESVGEPLFVDMDFSGNKRDYTVTFGGGFEDTRLGRVLLSADLLLKAFSLGIDPWTDVPPLTDDLCAGKNGSSMQSLYCRYIKGSHKERLNALLAKMVKDNEARALRIPIITSSANARDSSSCLLTLFYADRTSQEQIKSEIRRTGNFTASDNSRCFIPEERDLESRKRVLLERANIIFELTQYEKSIVLSSYKMKNPIHRSIYALLSLGSTRLKYFLDNDSKRSKQIFGFFEKMFRSGKESSFSDGTFYNNALYQGMFLFLYLLSEDAKFMDEFFNLNEVDRLTFTYIATAALADPAYVELIDKLQYAQPLCNGQTAMAVTEVNNFNDAFRNFVCNELGQFKRTYLADLIRKELKGINYKTASEISSGQHAAFRSSKMQQTRFWFYPGNEVVSLHKVDYSAFLFNKPNMVAKAERLSPLNERRGPYEAVSLAEDRIPGIHDNLDIVNKNYDALSDLFPTLKELNNVVKLLAFFRWIRDIQPNTFNLDAFETASSVPTPTPRIYPIYQTVTALPDGSMVRAVGGVDLHSNTHIGLKDLTELKDNIYNGTTHFEGKEYLVKPLAPPQDKSLTTSIIGDGRDSSLLVVKNTSHYTCSFLEKGNHLELALETANTLFHDRELHFIQKDNKDAYQYFQYINDKPTGYWTISTTSNGMITGSRQENIQGSEPVTQFLNSYLTEVTKSNMPLQPVWKSFLLLSDDVKMVATSKKLAFQLKMNDRPVILETENALDSETRAGSTNFAISFVSPLSTDSMYITNTGRVNSLDFDVRISTPDGIKTYPVKGGNIDIPLPSFIEKASNPVLSLAKTEYARGSFKSFELVNRGSLVQLAAVWQQQLSKLGKHLLINTGSGFYGLRNISSIAIPDKRIIVVDRQDMTPDRVLWFTKLAEQHPEAVVLLKEMKEMPVFDADEIIWITCLNENALKQQLAQLAGLKVFAQAKRFRCFNIDNAITDLGFSLFGENERLELAGAWPHAVDFITLQPVLEQLIDQPKQELNEQLHSIVVTLEAEYRASPSPLRLRIAHYLPDLMIVWEEAGNKNFGWNERDHR